MLKRTDQQEVSWEQPAISGLPNSNLPFWRLIEKLPVGAYSCDAEGLIT